MSIAPAPPVLATGRGSLILFFLLTFAITEPCFVGAVRIAAGSPWRTPLLYLGTFAPAIVALGLTWRAAGVAGVRALLGRITRGPVAARWFVFALFFMVVVKLLAAVLVRIATHAWPRFDLSEVALVPFVLAISTPVQAGEELGWRAYALPRLAARMGVAPASLLLGAIWALWHLPLFYLVGADTYGQAFPVYALSVIAISITMAWLYANSGGSLLVVMFFHAAINNTKDIVHSAQPGAHDVFGFGASPEGVGTMLLLAIFAGSCFLWMSRHDSRARVAIGAAS